VTPPGYVHEYGDSSAIRMTLTVSAGQGGWGQRRGLR
jgi:hypothetical protein